MSNSNEFYYLKIELFSFIQFLLYKNILFFFSFEIRNTCCLCSLHHHVCMCVCNRYIVSVERFIFCCFIFRLLLLLNLSKFMQLCLCLSQNINIYSVKQCSSCDVYGNNLVINIMFVIFCVCSACIF